MAECSSGQPSDPPRIAVNGRYLDEVQTRVEYGRDVRWAGFARAPAENHRAIVTDEAITLCLPTLTSDTHGAPVVRRRDASRRPERSRVARGGWSSAWRVLRGVAAMRGSSLRRRADVSQAAGCGGSQNGSSRR